MAVRAIRCPSCRAAVAADIVAAVGGSCPRCHRPLDPAARHERAGLKTLDRADQAAARGEDTDPLPSLKIVDAVGDALPPRGRAQWRTALRETAEQQEGARQVA